MKLHSSPNGNTLCRLWLFDRRALRVFCDGLCGGFCALYNAGWLRIIPLSEQCPANDKRRSAGVGWFGAALARKPISLAN